MVINLVRDCLLSDTQATNWTGCTSFVTPAACHLQTAVRPTSHVVFVRTYKRGYVPHALRVSRYNRGASEDSCLPRYEVLLDRSWTVGQQLDSRTAVGQLDSRAAVGQSGSSWTVGQQLDSRTASHPRRPELLSGCSLCIPNPLKRSGHYMYHQFDIQQFYVLPTQCIYVFCVDLRTNSDYFTVQH